MKLSSEPMNLNESIEAMKILAPYAKFMLGAETLGDAVGALLNNVPKIPERGFQIQRLIALMHHQDVEEVIEVLGKRKSDGSLDGVAYVEALAHGFTINPIADLLASSAELGIVEQGI